MKLTLPAAAAAFRLIIATAAHGEGNGDPFPFHAPALTVVPRPSYANSGSYAYPDLRRIPSRDVVADTTDVLSMTGSEAIVQTVSPPQSFSTALLRPEPKRP